MRTPKPRGASRTPRGPWTAAGSVRLATVVEIAMLVVCVLPGRPAIGAQACSWSASAVHRACLNESDDDFWIGVAGCINIADDDEREACRDETKEALAEARDECADQLEARREACEALGEDRYDPDFDPAAFETGFVNLNPYFPLAPGNQWVYVGGDETITVEATSKTKLIKGVTCLVVNDRVEEDGETIENTDDWYGQATNGDVHYCGEIAENFETFAGDVPEEPELVDIEGSWKTGRDGAKPGVIMFAFPVVGAIYRQELSWGDAEDMGEILSNSYGYGSDPDLDEFVPEALATLLCHDDCVVTRDFTPVEPDAAERKYYAPGIGPFLEVDLETGEITRLVDCNVDPVCAALPAP